jgi:TDG/mug DNA glycosylase family protein
MKSSKRFLPDHLKPGLRILFVGINPGLRSAALGHHFAGYSNRFWKLLYESDLVREPLTYRDDWRLPEWGIGLTNIVHRSTAGIDALDKSEFHRGRSMLERKILRYRPRLVALLGVTIFRALFPPEQRPAGRPRLGPTGVSLAGAPVYLLPNPSGRNAHYPYQTMLAIFTRLREEAGAQPT